MKISVLIPTRGRLQWLQECIESILTTASNPARIEILLGMDLDDTETVKGIQDTITLKGYKQVHVELFERAGYKNLEIYMNRLAELSTGDYLLCFNDDARIRTQGWDQVLEAADAAKDTISVFQLKNNHSDGNIFPFVPRIWYETLGHISLAAPYDSWIGLIADSLGVNKKIDAFGYHFRTEKEGEENAALYEDIGPAAYYAHKVMFSVKVQQMVKRDMFKLRNFLYSESTE